MLRTIKNWYQNKYKNNELIVFVGLIIFFYIILIILNNYITPILISFIIAYLLDAFINILQVLTKIKRIILVYVIYIIFIIILLSLIFILLPIIINQLIDFIKQASYVLSSFKMSLQKLSIKYPTLLTEDRINFIVNCFNNINWKEINLNVGSFILQNTATTLPLLFSALIYLFLVPLMVFYFLKDKKEIINFFKSFLPKNNYLYHFWDYLRPRLANYVKGKVIELMLVSIFSYISFILFNLNYSILLAVGVGLSVIIPYIGMIIITIPVVMIGILQFGLNMTFISMLIIFFIIQAFDGNILVPLLFSEILDVHPIIVILSVFIFGEIFGIWGVFFAIPLGLFFISTINILRNNIKIK